VQGGGVFVTGFRLGAKTDTSQMIRTPLPGLLRDVMGITIEDYVPIYSAKQGVRFSEGLAGADASCGMWTDILQPRGAEVLGAYTSGAHAGKAAVTVNKFGKGKAIYIGADLDGASLARVLQSLSSSAGVRLPFNVPRGVELTVRTAGGKQWTFLLNHTSGAQTVDNSRKCTDLLTRESISGRVNLGAYAVRVLQQG
jgi:beta-galactosidase